MRLTIFGTGYVGLVTGACLAEVGHDVVCIDIDEERITNLQNGIIPIFEPGLEKLVLEGINENKLAFTSEAKNPISNADAIMICVGTPDNGDGSTNLRSVISAAETISESLNKSVPVLIKSTVPVGTASKIEEKIKSKIEERNIDIKVPVASNPEFLHEGVAISDFHKPDRIILGTKDDHLINIAKDIYKDFIDKDDRMLIMSAESSELTKYASNAFLATKISFTNQLSHFSSVVGADIEEVRIGMGADSAIGESYLYAGCGFGGSCLPKDINSLIFQAGEKGKDLTILKAVRAVNESQKEYLFSLALKLFNNDLFNKVVAIWGLSFKPETDDMRGAPSLTIIKKLLEKGAKVRAYDPIVARNSEDFKLKHESLSLFQTSSEAAEGADCLIICTEWQEFSNPDLKELEKVMARKLILDGRNILNPSDVFACGFEYIDIGRSPVKK